MTESKAPGGVSDIGDELIDRVRRLRERLHQQPELSGQEHRTAELLRAELERLEPDGLRTGVGGCGLVAWFGAAEGGRTVALRAEMDALPLEERTGLAWASRNPGHMHACGHDGHMALGLGLAAWSRAHRDRLPGRLKLVFQPAEEEGGGARQMVAEGALRDPPVDVVLGVHARPQLAAGRIELAEIPSAAADGFDIHLNGRAAHGAYPHQGRDAVVAASQVVAALQQVVARQIAPASQAVVTIGALRAGRARNVIADEALLQGTLRSRDPQVRQRVIAAVERIAARTAEALGCTARFVLQPGYPRVHNDPALLELVERVGRRVLGPQQVLRATEATMGADDFSYYLSEQGGVPGCMIRLGVESEAALHTAEFDFGRRAIGPGLRLLAACCLELMAEGGGG
jgi:amidohydrolase